MNERNNLDLSGFPRLEAENNYDQEITLRIETVRFWEQKQKQQERENLCKWVMLVCAVTIIVVLALVWTGNL